MPLPMAAALVTYTKALSEVRVLQATLFNTPEPVALAVLHRVLHPKP